MHSGVKQLGWHTECLFVENHGKINKGWKCFLNTFHCFLRQINSSIDKRVVPGKFRALPAGGALQQHRTASGLENNPACLTALTHTGMMSPRHYWYMNFREQIKVFHRGGFCFLLRWWKYSSISCVSAAVNTLSRPLLVWRINNLLPHFGISSAIFLMYP